MSEEKRCKACKRIIVGESKTGLCPDCINKYGEGAAAGVGIIGIVALIAKGIIKVIRKK